MQFECTYTDTFGGELNYSWVRRALIEAPDDASTSLLMRRAKRALGLSGARCRVEAYADTIIAKVIGTATAIVIESEDK